MQTRLKANSVEPGTGIYPRLYLGGPKSVRGYSSNSFGGGSRYVKNYYQTAELNFPLFPKANMRFQLFYDYGTMGIESWDTIQKKSYGLNISWFSPLGPINFIFGLFFKIRPL